MTKQLVIATYNLGKVKEIKEFFNISDLKILSLKDFDNIGEIEETGLTFKENALIKARAVFKITKGFVLSDDSGLICDDLNGEPGVYSARYAGANSSDADNNKKLIQNLKAVHDPSRYARYKCAMVLINPDGVEHSVEETCEGLITFKASGNGGFGYDPYFYLPEYKCTMAEISLKEKNKISHRGKALQKIYGFLKTEYGFSPRT